MVTAKFTQSCSSVSSSSSSDAPDSAPSRMEISAVMDALRRVIDPELGVNLVDLGLIYSVRVCEGRVEVIMTVTTPGCPMEYSLKAGVEEAILSLDWVSEVSVQVTHDPPWNPSMMTDEGRSALGIR